MGNLRLFAVLALVLTVLTRVQGQSFLSDGLVAYYPFSGGNVTDATGHGFTLVNNGATPCVDRFGNPNQAYNFNGGNYMTCAEVPLNQAAGWTLVAWVLPATFSQAEEYVVCMGHDDGNSGDGFALGLQGGALFGFFGGIGFFPGDYVFPATNAWHQIIMERDTGSTMFYVDGVLTNTVAAGSPTAPSAFTIGSGTGIRFFDGAIGDVRIYNRALLSSEVEELYQYDTELNISYQATASAVVNNGFVTSITVTFNGHGYTNPPNVEITGGGGSGATAVTVISNGLVAAVNVLDAGSGYTSAPNVNIDPPSYPYPATAMAQLINGFVSSVSVLYPGLNYTNTPSVKLIGGGGTGALAIAIVTNGQIASIDVLNAGSGYTNAPIVVIAPPAIPNPVLSPSQMSLLTFSNLTPGANYQLQQLADNYYWTNDASNFTATNSIYTQLATETAGNGEYRLAMTPILNQAFAEPEIVNGFVVGATVTNGGSGYVSDPDVNIVGGGGAGATAVSQISAGMVTNIVITDAGIGYTNMPTIEIAPPPATTVSPTIQPVLQLNFSDLSPYDNYQLQFTTSLAAGWSDWNGGPFIPTGTTNSQYVFVTNGAAIFRLTYIP